jgi:membrane carboxypeptidase/penicillin-binding protein PbpC
VSNAADSGIVTITFPATAAPGADTPVNAFSLDGLVAAPVRDAQPDATAIDRTQYTGTIAWQTQTGEAHAGAFAASTVYKAVLTLTAKTGFTFTGVAENSFAYSGATSVGNAAGSGTVTITFPATAAEEIQDTVVTAFALDGLVAAPARDAQPDTTAIDQTQYTGTIAWQTETGAAHAGAFAPSTVYKAVLTLTAKTGFTFAGVAENSFAYSGATSVGNAADSGTVTITFPATAAEDANTTIPIGNPSIKLYLDDETVPLTQNGTTAITGAGTFTVSIDAGSYASIVWYLNGNMIPAAQNKTSIVLSKRTAGTYLVTVEASPDDGVKQSGAHSFTVQ